jgi:hypothetical protein
LARTGCYIEQVGIDAQEFKKTFQGGAELTKAGGHRRFLLFIIELSSLQAEKPSQVKSTQVAARDFGPD